MRDLGATMTTLVWRKPGSADVPTDFEPAPPVWPVLAELEVYTRTRRLLGWIAPEGERTSDWMNRGHELELLGAIEVPMAADRPALAEPGRELRRQRVSATDVLFAVPPSLPSGRHLRLHRRVIRIHFEMDDYDLRGRIHVRPGAEVGDYLIRSSRVFVPITDAELIHRAAPGFSLSLPVVIVNSRHVSRLHLMEGGSAHPAPASPQSPVAIFSAPTLDTATGVPDVPETLAADVHRALTELTAMHVEGLVTDGEFRAKRAEILARL